MSKEKKYELMLGKAFCFYQKPKSEGSFMFRGEMLGYDKEGKEDVVYVYVYEREKEGRPYLIVEHRSKNEIRERLRNEKKMKEINEL